VEPEYSRLKRAIEKELLPCCCRYYEGILPDFPFVSGFLTGKYRRGQLPGAGTRFAVQMQCALTILTPENFDVLDQREAFAAPPSRPVVELAFACLIAHPQESSVIAGATIKNLCIRGIMPDICPDEGRMRSLHDHVFTLSRI
jgi:aryl-alcohol dehydrogenase-like predicted oxidoreductase